MKIRIMDGSCFVLVVLVASLAFASGGEQKEEAAAGAPKIEKPWLAAETLIASLKAKSDAFDKTLKEQIEARKKAISREQGAILDKEIHQTYKSLKEANAELRKQESLFKYRYPEKMAKDGIRTYDTRETPSLEIIEEQIGIEGKLKRNLRRMRSQYGTAAQKKAGVDPVNHELTPEQPARGSEKSAPTGDSQTIRDQNSIILSK